MRPRTQGKYSSAIDCRLIFNQLAPPSWRKVIQTKLRPAGCSSRLRGCPFWEDGACCFVGGSFRAFRWCLEFERVLLNGGLHHPKGKQFGTPYVTIAVDRYSSKAKKTTGSGDNTRLWRLRGINGWQGTPWSEELDSNEVHGARSLVARTVWIREDPIFPAHHSSRSQHSSSSIEICGIMLVSTSMARFLFTWYLVVI